MPCILALFALFVPRLVIVLLWFFSNWFDAIFDTLLWPVLGLIFLPTTLLWYTVVVNYFNGEWGIVQVLVLILALIIDISPAGGRRD